jgi:hypothetical protein
VLLWSPQISLETKDVLIECTATDLTKAKVVLNTVACMFSQYCKVPFEVEPVEVIDSFGESHGGLHDWEAGLKHLPVHPAAAKGVFATVNVAMPPSLWGVVH